MGVLQNYVILEQGIPTRLHFTDHHIERRSITDPVTGQAGSRNTLVFDVDRMDGVGVMSKFSTMAEKLAAKFEPYLADKSYTKFDFTITQTGEGFRTVYTVTVTPTS